MYAQGFRKGSICTQRKLLESAEHGCNTAQGGDKGVDLGPCVICRERGAHCAFDTETLHEGLRAVVACTHGNAELVEEYAGIVVVCIADKKRNHGTLVWGCAVNT